MKRKILTYLGIVGLFMLMSSCEKDGNEVIMLADPIPPTIVSMPDNLILQRSNSTDKVQFAATPVNPGFAASATYFLEAALSGTDFADPLLLYSGSQDTLIEFTVSDLNELFLKKFTEDVTSSIDFRIRAVLLVDAGTGAPGTGDNAFEYTSAAVTRDVAPFGLPRLDLIGTDPLQKITSAQGNGVYSSFVKLSSSVPFTLKNPDTGKTYGTNAAGDALEENGNALTATDNGWYKLTADINNLTYSIDAHMYGVVGSATPNDWNSPDTKMDYDAKRGVWYVTLDLIVGEIKFRKNDGWAWNLGGTPDNLVQDGANIAISEAGNYTITLTITDYENAKGTCTIVKNN